MFPSLESEIVACHYELTNEQSRYNCAVAEKIAAGTGEILTDDVSADENIPEEATAVLMRIKLKAHIPNQPASAGSGYAQANVRFVNDDPALDMNHLIHVDEWGRGSGFMGEGRRIPNVTLFAPIKDEKIRLRVAREISRRGIIQFVAYREGLVV